MKIFYAYFTIFETRVIIITVKFVTLGCKTNFYESEALAELFRQAGHEVVQNGRADAYVINTCTVTGTGAQKSRQQIRRARKQNPNAVVAVTGCYAQTEAEKVQAMPEVDIVVGNARRTRLVELVEQAAAGKTESDVTDIMKERKFEELTVAAHQSRVRANVKIEDGCNNFCSYCIIPYARGPVRSRSMENIVREVEELGQSGYAEIVLTGIHIGSYGLDGGEYSLIDVVEAIHPIEGIARIRLGSIEPVVITEDFVRRAAKLDKLCRQFHLSLQSGCDATLERMRRRYTTAQYREAVARLREYLPNVSITTDMMVGFAGETEEDFEQSYSFAKEIGFLQMHVFPYSIREGTRAAEFPDQLPEKVKEERAHKMIALSDEMKRNFCEQYLNQPIEVLLEQKKADGRYHATSANYMEFLVENAEGEESGILLPVLPYAYQDGILLARVIR